MMILMLTRAMPQSSVLGNRFTFHLFSVPRRMIRNRILTKYKEWRATMPTALQVKICMTRIMMKNLLPGAKTGP